MGKITKIEEQKNNKSRMSIFIDGEYSFSVEKIVALERSLKEGTQLSESDIKDLMSESDEEKAMKQALKYIAIRQRTKYEMLTYLKGKNYSDFVIAKIIDKLEYYNYINDIEFIKAYVSAFGGKYGEKRIKSRLFQLGVPGELADKFLINLPQVEACEKDKNKYLRTHKDCPREKLFTYLLSKGYSGETISKVLDGDI